MTTPRNDDRKAASPALPRVPEGEPEPAWAIATLFPGQGCWSEADYLELPTNRLVELADGRVEVLPMPTRLHQKIVACLFEALKAFATAGNLGEVYFAPLPVHLWPGRYREPDVVFVRAGNRRAFQGEYLEGADLVMEVVSADDADRDWHVKRIEYARAGVEEYWVVDPFQRRITVFSLERGAYAVYGEFREGSGATSAMLPGFSLDVADVLARGDDETRGR